MATVLILILCVYGALQLGLFHKKDDPKDLSAGILKMAAGYQELNSKYQRLQGELQQKNDEEKELQIRQLKVQLDDSRRQLMQGANHFDSVLAADPRAYGGVSLVPSQAVDAWVNCVHITASSSASSTVGAFTAGGGMTSEEKKCDTLLQKSLSNVSKTTN
jgi:hypothetical protein